MENRKGKSPMHPSSNDDQLEKIDLTLRLGISNEEKKKLKESKDGGCNAFLGYSNMNDHIYNKGFYGNFGVGGSASTYGSEVGIVTTPFGPFPSSIPYGVGSSRISFYDPGFLPQGLESHTPTLNMHDIDDTKVCSNCGVKSTPLWRKGPRGAQTLCNACGLRHSRDLKKGGK